MRLPPKVHEKNGRYYYVHKNKWTGLTRTDEGISALYLALHWITTDAPATLGQLMDHYLARGMDDLAAATKTSYLGMIDGRLRHAFGHMRIDSLKPAHVAQYLETRKREGHPARGNREHAVLSSIHEATLHLTYHAPMGSISTHELESQCPAVIDVDGRWAVDPQGDTWKKKTMPGIQLADAAFWEDLDREFSELTILAEKLADTVEVAQRPSQEKSP